LAAICVINDAFDLVTGVESLTTLLLHSYTHSIHIKHISIVTLHTQSAILVLTLLAMGYFTDVLLLGVCGFRDFLGFVESVVGFVELNSFL